MKFPFRISSRSRYERMKRSEMKCSEEAIEFYNRFSELQKTGQADDKILTAAALNTLLTAEAFSVIDVGANQGDWSRAFLRRFPKAVIHAIEADPKTFELLRQNTAAQTNIHPVNLAVSSKTGKVSFYSHENPLCSSMLNLPDARGKTRMMEVEAQTLDAFCAARKLDDVRFIKIDTEGHDLEVVKGARQILKSPALEFIVLEFGIDSADQRHVHVNELVAALSPPGFQVQALGGFGFYDGYFYGNALFVKNKTKGLA
jgi:FkbM family methyltransferase